jgi:hypothetical protein
MHSLFCRESLDRATSLLGGLLLVSRLYGFFPLRMNPHTHVVILNIFSISQAREFVSRAEGNPLGMRVADPVFYEIERALCLPKTTCPFSPNILSINKSR